MASLSTTVREQLIALARKNSSDHLAIDVYRAARVQAELLYQTECIRQNLAEDPFRALQGLNIKDIGEKLRVVDYDCVRTRQDYVRIQAQVEVSDRKKRSRTSQLVFLFERETADEGRGTMLKYSIEFASNASRANCKILWVQVIAAGSYPSQKPAINMGDTEDDEWSDVPSDDQEEDSIEEADQDTDEVQVQDTGKEQDCDQEGSHEIGNQRKRMKRSNGTLDEASGPEQTLTGDRDGEEDCDRFVANMDPDVLVEFIGLVGEMDEATAFFLLMSFPFYEMEWDLVGFVLDAVFGSQSDSDDDEATVASDKSPVHHAFSLTSTMDGDTGGDLNYNYNCTR